MEEFSKKEGKSVASTVTIWFILTDNGCAAWQGTRTRYIPALCMESANLRIA